MRLQEPVNGIKIAVGHVIIHLAFLISMFEIDRDVTINLNYSSKKESKEEAHRLLAGAAVSSYATDIEVLDPQEVKQHELDLFYMIWAAHGCCFVVSLLIMYLKGKKYANISQVLANLMLVGYLMTFSYVTYYTKKNIDEWEYDVNYVRIWLLIESIYFYVWLIASIIFVIIAYVSKFRSTIVNDAVLQNDDNVWNDRQTDDFLRYIKFDYYVFTLYLSCLLMDIIVGVTLGETLTLLGPADFKPTGLIMLILVIQRTL